MASIVIRASNTKRNNNNINIKNLHDIYPNFHFHADILKPYFYTIFHRHTVNGYHCNQCVEYCMKYNNINIKNLHEICPNFHLIAYNLKPYFYRRSFTDTTLMATIVISPSNTTRNNNEKIA